jgi:hypothetical protein
MSFGDFCHYFSRVQICRNRDDWSYSHFRAEHPKGSSSIMRLVVPEDSTQYITVSQLDKRCFPRGDKYDYSSARLVIARAKEDGTLDYMTGKMKVERDMWEQVYFEAGDYLVYVEVDWVTEETNDFVVSSYGPVEAVWIRDEKADHPKFLQEVYMSCARKHGKVQTFESDGAPECYKYSQMCAEGYGYTFFENKTEDATIKEIVTYTKFEGLELIKPYKGSGYEVQVKPGDQKIILLRQTVPYGYSLSFSYSSNIIFSPEALKK